MCLIRKHFHAVSLHGVRGDDGFFVLPLAILPPSRIHRRNGSSASSSMCVTGSSPMKGSSCSRYVAVSPIDGMS